MSKAIYPALVSAAAIVAATGAVKAAPIAIESFGFAGGSLLTAGVSIAIFAGWHTAFDTTKTLKARAIGLGAAVVFSAASVLAINSSATAAYQLKEQAAIDAEKAVIDNANKLQLEKYQAAIDAEKARVDAINSDAVKAWQDRETKRLDLLAQVTSEMKETSKKKNPQEYAALLEQMTALQVAEPQPAKEKAEVFTAPMLQEFRPKADNLQKTVTLWVQSLAYEVVAPMLLLLASFYRREYRLPSVTVPLDTAERTTMPSVTAKNGNTKGNTSRTNAEQKKIDPLKAIKLRLIECSTKDGVGRQAIMDACACGQKAARKARVDAVASGDLVQMGDGAGARFFYPEFVSLVGTSGLSESDNVVSMEEYLLK